MVGRLAARHGIRVSLRESPYGGTTAIVLMPHSVIVREGETRSRGPASGTGQPAPAGTPAAPLPADATGPIPLPDDGTGLVAHLEGASVFSLTGRHRLGPVPPQNGTVPGRDQGLPSAAGAGRHLAGGEVRQTIIEMESAFLFVMAAGQGTCLAVVSSADANVGVMAYEMAMLVRRMGKYLTAAPRFPDREPAAG